MEWSGKVAIVTGASSGIGLACAQAFARRGTQVALVARTKERLEEAAREIGEARAAAFPLDVTDRAAVAGLPARVVERFGRLDLLVNNAGANARGPLSHLTPEEIAQVLETHLVAPALLVRSALPYLARGGAIVNVASLAGKVPVPDEAPYSASKAGLRAFGAALEGELRERGLRLTTVNPGPVDTGFLQGGEAVPDLVFSQPMSTPEEVADAVVRAVETGAREIDLPFLSGKLCTLGYLFPRLYRSLRPFLARVGARNKARYATSRG